MTVNNKNFSNKLNHFEPMAEEADTIKCLTTKVTLLDRSLNLNITTGNQKSGQARVLEEP